MSLCHLSWDSYKNNICNGFARLQQREEFVDMTLAAEGHLVQVHRSLVAVASPYIKEMLKMAPCPNPVVFLNGVSYDVLRYLLEYIYTGEVKVPIERMKEFVKQAKALHIVGVDNIGAPLCPRQVVNENRQKSRHDMERMTNEDLQKNSSEQSDDMVDVDEQNRQMSPLVERHETSQISGYNIERTANEDPQNENMEQLAVIIQENKTMRDFKRKGGKKQIRGAANAAEKLILKHSSDGIPTRRLRRRLNLREKRTVNEDSNQQDLQNKNFILPYFSSGQSEQKKSMIEINHVTESHLEPQVNNYIDTNLAYNTEPNDLVLNPIDFEDEMLQNYIENVKNSASNINNEPQSSHSVVNLDDQVMITNVRTLTDENNIVIPITSTIADTTNVSNQDFETSNNTEALISIDANEVNEMLNSDVNTRPEISADYNIEFKMLTEDGQTKHETITIKPLDQLSSIQTESVINTNELKDVSPYYMLSEKKRLIAIFNRYMYYQHHSSKNGMKRRWRCIQYRQVHCKAYVDTNGEVIENRKFEHTHPYHDTQIMKKADSKKPMFTTIAEALASKIKSGDDANEITDCLIRKNTS